ncbi:Nitrogen assimilation control protein [Georgfuchsia toluolica]|uniref:Nitrogen assimilation control protein n=1 Tax=Georgfuchsia toluolica TaxID=424218 RepID=A0A916J3R1_9PROT|nr:LysR substrate-binding domain-containing protein [Georgfuchsia toluolica]CAG4883295.1 Nitrogen assimilation control protein [Georgfuchsia toluolica]
MNLKQLEYFVRVAELGSFSKASLILNIAQPALSRQVRLLETDLRVTLLLRNGRGVVLTEAGQRLFDQSLGILQLVSRVREDLESTRGEPGGRIVVGLPPSMGRLLTLPLVDGFRRALPKARLAIVEGLSAHLAEWIATGRVDIGLLHNPDSQTALELVPVLDESLGMVSPATNSRKIKVGASAAAKKASSRAGGSLAGLGDTVTLAELTGFPLILPERTHAIRKLLETQAALAGRKLNVALEISSVQSILELVRAGHGHAILTPTALAASGQPEAYVLRKLVEPSLASTLCLAVSAHKPATPLTKHMLRLLRELILAAAETVPSPTPSRAHNKMR